MQLSRAKPGNPASYRILQTHYARMHTRTDGRTHAQITKADKLKRMQNQQV